MKRLERYRLQAIAKEALPEHRVCKCYRHVLPKGEGVQVWKGKDRAYYTGLLTCGSVWVCPVCGAKISERRRQELLQGMGNWQARGGVVVMLTQTLPHYIHQPLKVVLDGASKARGLMRHRKGWKRIAARIGLVGSVRALEVTYGENGWHVHFHELLFLPASVDLAELERELLPLWQSACTSAGMLQPNGHGIRIHSGDQAGEYASKWGLDCEMSKAHLKRGREGGKTPWDLLRGIAAGEPGVELFQEYAKAFKGRRQLVWSEGLRELLGVGEEETDEAIAAQADEEAELLGKLTSLDWYEVLKAEKRGELLEIAFRNGWRAVLAFIADLVEQRRMRRGRAG